MSAEIIPFDFEEQAVRVVMRDGAPWFVAADVCRVLEVGNPSDAVRRLEDDERMTLDTIEGQTGRGGARTMNIISESGLYALIFTSRKEAARRFRRWVTGEVLPAIRATGRYEQEPALPGGAAARDVELWLAMVREARLNAGTAAGRRVWHLSPLPALAPGPARGPAACDPAEGRACLAHLVAARPDITTVTAAVCYAARAHGRHLYRTWAADGLRVLPDGLFVANGALPVFEGTRWQGGAHRAALLALPGAAVDSVARTLGGRCTRGIVVAFAEMENCND